MAFALDAKQIDESRPGGRPSGLASRVTLGFDVEGIDGLTGRHEQSVSFGAAEAEVSTAFRQQDTSD